jgi:malate dehydrogenase (oxaloacetate-decarboxylating)(NADP+)
VFEPGQANNSYVFPGIGLGVVAAGAQHVVDEMFMRAARTLADHVSEEDLARGSLFPRLSRIRELSAAIALEVARVAYERGLATAERPADLEGTIKSQMYQPYY